MVKYYIPRQQGLNLCEKPLAYLCETLDGCDLLITHANRDGVLIDEGEHLLKSAHRRGIYPIVVSCHPAAVARLYGVPVVGEWEGQTDMVGYDLKSCFEVVLSSESERQAA